MRLVAGTLWCEGLDRRKRWSKKIGKGTLRWAGPEEFAGLPLMRAADSYKGKYGHVLVGGGSVGKSGAAVLGGKAALRGGAGLVTLAVAEPILPIVAMSAAGIYDRAACRQPPRAQLRWTAFSSGQFRESS